MFTLVFSIASQQFVEEVKKASKQLMRSYEVQQQTSVSLRLQPTNDTMQPSICHQTHVLKQTYWLIANFPYPLYPLSFSALGVCVVLVEVLGRDNPFRISGKALRILKLEPTVKIS